MATVGGSQDALNAGDDVKAIEACVPCIWKQGNIYNTVSVKKRTKENLG